MYGPDELLHLLARTVQEQSAIIRELAQNARDARGPKHKREKRLREIARDIVQEELFERGAELATDPPPRHKRRSPGHVSYTRSEFDTRLRAAITFVWDPDNFVKLTIGNVVAHLHVSGNTLWSMLKDYGYVQADETQAKCLRRLADEWHPEWRGINRRRF